MTELKTIYTAMGFNAELNADNEILQFTVFPATVAPYENKAQR